MNLNAIGLGPITPERSPGRVSPDTPAPGGQEVLSPGTPRQGDSSHISTAARAARPKADADTQLWGVLSREERGFYLRHGMKGQATYRPETGATASATSGARLGARIDMRI